MRQPQLVLSRLGDVDASDLWSIAQPGSIDRSRWHLVFPLLGALMLATVVIVPFYPQAILLLMAGTLVNLACRVIAAPR